MAIVGNDGKIEVPFSEGHLSQAAKRSSSSGYMKELLSKFLKKRSRP